MLFLAVPRLGIGLLDNIAFVQSLPALVALRFDPLLLLPIDRNSPVNTALAQQSTRLRPRQSRAWKIMGLTALIRADYSSALAAFGQMENRDWFSRLMQGRVLIVLGREDQALEVLRGEPVDHLLAIAARYANVGNREKAFPLWKLAARAHPNSAMPLKALSAALAKSDPAQALELLDRVTRLNPSEVEPYVAAAWVYVEKREYETSLEWCNHAKELAPHQVDGYLCAGKTYFYWGRYSSALAEFQQAQGFNQRRAEVYFWLANTYNATGEYSQAEKNFKISVSLHPGAFDYHLALAQFYDRQGLGVLAVREYEIVLKLNPYATIAQDRIRVLR